MNQTTESNHEPTGSMSSVLVKYLLLAVLVLGNSGGLPVRAADAPPEISRLSVANVHSTCMSKDIEAAIMLPSSYAVSAGRRYEEFPGGHTQDFWARSFLKHVEFFSKYLAAGK